MPREVKLQFVPALGMASIFADHVTLQSIGDVILLTFYQVEPPMVSKEEAEKIDTATAYPVARIAIRPEAAKRLGAGLTTVVAALTEAPAEVSHDVGPT